MPSAIPLPGEVWLRREDNPTANITNVGQRLLRVRIIRTENDKVYFHVRINKPRVLTVNEFKNVYRYQNEHNYPQKGSLWVRNANSRRVGHNLSLGEGRLPVHMNAVLYVSEGLNVTDYDFSERARESEGGGSLAGSIAHTDSCSVRIYNTDDENFTNPTGVMPHGPGWGGDLDKTDKAVIRTHPNLGTDNLSSAKQSGGGGQSVTHSGGFIGYRLLRRKLRHHYTFVGWAPEYYENIPWFDESINIPKVGQIYKWRGRDTPIADLTDGVMVLSVSWSRRPLKDDRWALTRGVDVDTDGYPKMFRLRGKFKMGSEKIFDKVHWPEDKPTLIVTTVNVVWQDEGKYNYWNYMRDYHEVNMFNKYLVLIEDAPGAVAPLVRYREMMLDIDSHDLSDHHAITTYDVENMVKDGTLPPADDMNKGLTPFPKLEYWMKIKESYDVQGLEMVKSVYFDTTAQVDRIMSTPDEDGNPRVSIIETRDNKQHKMAWYSERYMLGGLYPSNTLRRFKLWNYRMTHFHNWRWRAMDELKDKLREEMLLKLKYKPYEMRVYRATGGIAEARTWTYVIMSLPTTETTMVLGTEIARQNEIRVVKGPWIWMAELYKWITEQGFLNNPNPSQNEKIRMWIDHTPVGKSGVVITNWNIISDKDNRLTPAYRGLGGFNEYPLASEKGKELLFGSLWTWKGGGSPRQTHALLRLLGNSGVPDGTVLILGPVYSPDTGMKLLKEYGKQWVYAMNQINRDEYSGVYYLDVEWLFKNYDKQQQMLDGFQHYRVRRRIIQNLALESDPPNATQWGRSSEYYEYTIWLPPGLDSSDEVRAICNFPRAGEWWHMKKQENQSWGADPGRPGEVLFDHSYSRKATDYVNWPLLLENNTQKPAVCDFVLNHRPPTTWSGSHQRFISPPGDENTSIDFGNRLEIWLRGLRWIPRKSQVYMHNESGRLYSLKFSHDSVNILHSNFEGDGIYHRQKTNFFPLSDEVKKKWKVSTIGPTYPEKITRTDQQLTEDFNGEFSFLGYRGYEYWTQINQPNLGAVYVLRHQWPPERGRYAHGRLDQKGRNWYLARWERPPPLKRESFRRLLYHIKSKTGITLKEKDNVMVIGKPINGHIKIHLLFDDIPEDRNPIVELPLVEFHTLFVLDSKLIDISETSDSESEDEEAMWAFDSRRESYKYSMAGDFDASLNVGKYRHFNTYKEARGVKARAAANAAMNKKRAKEEASSVTEWTCVICMNPCLNPDTGENDPQGIVTSHGSNDEDVSGYIFTHDSTSSLALPHMICGGCAANVIRYDRQQRDNGNRQLLNADNDIIYGQYMGGKDNNNCANGPFTIECPSCRQRHEFRRLQRVLLSRRTRQGEQKVVWKELDKLTLKF